VGCRQSPIDRGFIEVHHTKPLSESEGDMETDPATDLVPVCSNCHRMIHRRKDDVLSVLEMGEIFKKVIDSAFPSYKKKPSRCPYCNSNRLAEIMYGEPIFSDELEEALGDGRIVLGGCCVSENVPCWIIPGRGYSMTHWPPVH
jgi:HNH endonuclease